MVMLDKRSVFKKAAALVITVLFLLAAGASLGGTITSFAEDEETAVTVTVPCIKSPKATQGKYRNKIVVTWGSAKNSKVDRYLIMRKNASENKWHKLAYVSNTTNRYVDKISGTIKYYQYKVIGVKKVDGVTYQSDFNASGTAKGWSLVTICIDPGHYLDVNNNFSEKGANGAYPYSEAQQMLKLGLKLKTSIESYGISTKITRAAADQGMGNVNIYYKGLSTRGEYSKNCDYFISLHTNAVTSAGGNVWNQSANNVYVFVNQRTRSGDDFNLAADLGEAVATQMKSAGVKGFNKRMGAYTGTVSSGSGSVGSVVYRPGKNGDWYTVLYSSNKVGTPGVLIEHSFHVNPNVRKFLLNDTNLKNVANAEAKAVAKHYGFPV